jgi:hypothetical protein
MGDLAYVVIKVAVRRDGRVAPWQVLENLKAQAYADGGSVEAAKVKLDSAEADADLGD